MTNVSRLVLDHPSLDTPGGSDLHEAIEAIYTKIGDNISSRYQAFEDVPNTTTVEFTHGLDCALEDLALAIFVGVGAGRTRVLDPVAAGWVIAANVGSPETVLDITTPDSGGDHTFCVVAFEALRGMALQAPNAVNITGGSVRDVKLGGQLNVEEQLASAIDTPPAGELAFFADNKRFYSKDSTGSVTQIGSGGSGQGALNYVRNPSAQIDTGEWSVGGGGVGTLSRITSSVPRQSTTGTAFQFAVTDTAVFARTRFSLDSVDLNKKLSLQIAHNTTGLFKIEVFKNSASDYSGTYTEIPLSSDVSGDTVLLVGNQATAVSFDTDSVPYLEFRLVYVGVGGDTVSFSNVIIGPGFVVQGMGSRSPASAGFIQAHAGGSIPIGWVACDGSALSQTDYADLFGAIGSSWNTATNPTTGSAYSAPSAGQFRVPDLRGVFVRGIGTPSGVSAVTLGGYQPDRVQPHSHNLYANTGDTSSGSTTVVELKLHTSATTNEFMVHGSGADNPNAIGNETRPRNVGVNYIIKLYNDQAINVGANNVQIASNSDSSNADNTTSFAPGIFSLIPNRTAGTEVVKRVRFARPVPESVVPVVKFKNPIGTVINPLTLFGYPSQQSTVSYGITVTRLTGSATDFNVTFNAGGIRPTGATYASNGDPFSGFFSSGWTWALEAAEPGQAVGFGEYIPGGASGLVAAQGVRGRTDGVAVPEGFVGHYKSVAIPAMITTTANTWTYPSSGGEITLPPGIWEIGYDVTIYLGQAGATSAIVGNAAIAVGTSVVADSISYAGKPSSGTNTAMALGASRRFVRELTATTTYRMAIRCNVATVNGAVQLPGTGVTGELTDPDNSQILWARCIG